MFTDEVVILIKAGDGGNGCQSYAKTIKAAFMGPDGGDGGRGGDVLLQVDSRLNSLNQYRRARHHKGYNGEAGGKHKDGKSAPHLFLKVPLGTCVFNEENQLLADLNRDGQSYVLATGGRGGRGNRSLKTKTDKLPGYAEKGEPMPEVRIRLELKLTAAVAIVGFPNAGKSTLISKMSNARPKVADYPFTTLEPNLGMVESSNGDGFLVADIPGLIEGAHQGAGLGHKFLRHIERCGFILHLIDMYSFEYPDPFEVYQKLNHELQAYSPKLANKNQILVLNKMDLPEARERCDELLAKLPPDLTVLKISALSGEGVQALKFKLAELIQLWPPQLEVFEDQIVTPISRPTQVLVNEDGDFVVSGDMIERICNQTDFLNYNALHRLQKTFVRTGLIELLKASGVREGDRILIGGKALHYKDDTWDSKFESDTEEEALDESDFGYEDI